MCKHHFESNSANRTILNLSYHTWNGYLFSKLQADFNIGHVSAIIPSIVHCCPFIFNVASSDVLTNPHDLYWISGERWPLDTISQIKHHGEICVQPGDRANDLWTTNPKLQCGNHKLLLIVIFFLNQNFVLMRKDKWYR